MATGKPETEDRVRDCVQYFKKHLRSIFAHSISYRQTLEKAKEKRGHLAFYECAACHLKYKKWNVEVDHIIPLTAAYRYGHRSFARELADLTFHLFNEKNMQVLCRSCHANKTFFKDKAKK